MRVFIITGISGSGKSVALNALEDAGYDCVDNLPVDFIHDLVESLGKQGREKVAVAIDGRRGQSIQELPKTIEQLKSKYDVRVLFLNSNTETLVQRFSETRRRHPLSKSDDNRTPQVALIDAIEKERALLSELAESAHNIDTSHIKAHTLRSWIQDLLKDERPGLTMLFESFGFKHGVPLDVDFSFDVRVLPNPYWFIELRSLTGKDKPVQEFLNSSPEVQKMIADIERCISDWIPEFKNNNRSYVTVGIGCTGGQHRSVFIAEQLADIFTKKMENVQVRHRELSV